MRHRRFVHVLVVCLVLAVAALPARAQPKPSGANAEVTFGDNGDCTVTVTYTWSGFKGRDLVLQYGVRWALGGGAVYSVFVQEYPVGSSGTSSYTFDLVGRGAHDYYGGGALYDRRGKVLAGSAVRSATSASLDC